MVGSALVRRLEKESCSLVHLPRRAIDLREQSATRSWIKAQRPDVIFLAAARVGGISANAANPVSFLYDNLMIEANIIHASYEACVERLVFLGSTCTYPKMASQPIPEEALLTGPLEETNEWYAIAKIAGIKLIQAYRQQFGKSYISCQPANLYGPGDNYDSRESHVLPALLRRAHEAKKYGAERMTVWGSGRPIREFLHVDDLADAVVFLTVNYDGFMPINIGSGEEISIKDLAHLVCRLVGFSGELEFDGSKPDGTPRKLADTRRLRDLGWSGARSLARGIVETYDEWRKAECKL